jgi:hypothetical protein
MAHSYKSEYPTGVQVDDGIKAFFEEFYKTSDTPDAHEKYADSFTKDATIIVASKKAVGSEGVKSRFSFKNIYLIFLLEILQFRKGMWTTIASRLHTPHKIFPFGSGSNEVMLYGNVVYTLKDGRKADVSCLSPSALYFFD